MTAVPSLTPPPPRFLFGSPGPPQCDSGGSCAGDMFAEGISALLCSAVVPATCSAIAHAETRPSLPGGSSRNALCGLHAALPAARGR